MRWCVRRTAIAYLFRPRLFFHPDCDPAIPFLGPVSHSLMLEFAVWDDLEKVVMAIDRVWGEVGARLPSYLQASR